jgi:hypothetical protein
MKGIAKIIDELGLIILAKDAELNLKQEEINRLNRKIEIIEQYLDMYENNCNNQLVLKN